MEARHSRLTDLRVCLAEVSNNNTKHDVDTIKSYLFVCYISKVLETASWKKLRYLQNFLFIWQSYEITKLFYIWNYGENSLFLHEVVPTGNSLSLFYKFKKLNWPQSDWW